MDININIQCYVNFGSLQHVGKKSQTDREGETKVEIKRRKRGKGWIKERDIQGAERKRRKYKEIQRKCREINRW